MNDIAARERQDGAAFNAAEIGALAHLYRGEVYRSQIWRTRLDATTNWAVVTTGIALSAAFSSREASPLPLVLVGLLVSVFLLYEARRYRYFDVWRMRARMLETHLYAPMLLGRPIALDDKWQRLLARDYLHPAYHIGFLDAVGRRLRRNYGWILAIQAVAYYGKLAIHPEPMDTLDDIWDRAAIGPVPGELVVLAGIMFHGGWLLLAWWTWREQQLRRQRRDVAAGDDPLRVAVRTDDAQA
jgi:uncharacterized membrane protein